MSARRYEERVVLVTGGAQGLGFAMAERFALEGATVALCDLSSDRVETAASSIAGEVTGSCVDVTQPEQVDAWVASVMERTGRIDVLVNNAGIIRDRRLELMTDDDFSSVLDVSLRGAFNGSRAVFPRMKEAGYGRIVSMASMSWRGMFGQVNYSAAKAGIVGLARSIAIEGAPHAITSNVIAPGMIDTPMLASLDARAREKMAARVPVGRIGRPEEIAEAAAFLCSEQAGYVTGVVLDVDGGIGVGVSLR